MTVDRAGIPAHSRPSHRSLAELLGTDETGLSRADGITAGKWAQVLGLTVEPPAEALDPLTVQGAVNGANTALGHTVGDLQFEGNTVTWARPPVHENVLVFYVVSIGGLSTFALMPSYLLTAEDQEPGNVLGVSASFPWGSGAIVEHVFS